MNPLTNYEKGWNLRKEGGLPRKGGGGGDPLTNYKFFIKIFN